jgi:hypothetical protein
MRSLWLLALLAACSSRAVGIGVGVSEDGAVAPSCAAPRLCSLGIAQQQMMVEGVCSTVGGDLDIQPDTTQASTLKFCHCMHGCGPGIDGAFPIVVTNYSPTDHVLAIRDLFFTSADGALTYENQRPVDGLLHRRLTCAGDPTPWNGTVVSGSVEPMFIDEHFDVMSLHPGTYRLRLQLDVDGQLRWFELGTVTLAEGPACAA